MTHERMLSLAGALDKQSMEHTKEAQIHVINDSVYTSRMTAALVCRSLAQSLQDLVAYEQSLSA